MRFQNELFSILCFTSSIFKQIVDWDFALYHQVNTTKPSTPSFNIMLLSYKSFVNKRRMSISRFRLSENRIHWDCPEACATNEETKNKIYLFGCSTGCKESKKGCISRKIWSIRSVPIPKFRISTSVNRKTINRSFTLNGIASL